MNRYSIARDRNGNRILRVQPSHGRGFSIQTNGNLPRTHRDGVGDWTVTEARDYVTRHGTPRQKRVMEVDRFDLAGFDPR
jgi:hypothetical protein